MTVEESTFLKNRKPTLPRLALLYPLKSSHRTFEITMLCKYSDIFNIKTLLQCSQGAKHLIPFPLFSPPFPSFPWCIVFCCSVSQINMKLAEACRDPLPPEDTSSVKSKEASETFLSSSVLPYMGTLSSLDSRTGRKVFSAALNSFVISLARRSDTISRSLGVAASQAGTAARTEGILANESGAERAGPDPPGGPYSPRGPHV